MQVRRRRLTSTPLLVATAGAAMMIASCEATTSGNLVAPAEAELCVSVTPAEAMAQIQFNNNPVATESGCDTVYQGAVEVQVDAEGYQTYEQVHDVFEDTTLDIALQPAEPAE